MDGRRARHNVVELSVVVPLFNEEVRLGEHYPVLLKWLAAKPVATELILVDDGSEDATRAVARTVVSRAIELGIDAELVEFAHRGKGATVAAGLACARGAYAGFCDVDLSTPLEHFDAVISTALASHGLAIASREAAGAVVARPESRLREQLGRLYNRLLQIVLVPGIRDTQCGAKAAPTELWQAVVPFCVECGWAWDVELVAMTRRLGFSVEEVPVEWYHDTRSRIHLVTDGIQLLAAVPRIWRRVRRVPASAPSMPDRVTSPGEPHPSTSTFDESQAATLIENDQSHWWFSSKAYFVSEALAFCPPADCTLLLDVGAGAGGVTKCLDWKGARFAIEASLVLATAASHRGVTSIQAASERLPIADGSASVVCLLDVIEHLADPVPTLREVRRVLAEDGRLVVTVPAHRWLWSAADDFLSHKRRYNRSLLRSHLSASGFETCYARHVFSWLVLPVWLTRRVARNSAEDQLGLGSNGPLLTQVAALLTRAEAWSSRWLNSPVGTTIVAVARPTPSAANRTSS
jgi:SAM-dependent methyltransferase